MPTGTFLSCGLTLVSAVLFILRVFLRPAVESLPSALHNMDARSWINRKFYVEGDDRYILLFQRFVS